MPQRSTYRDFPGGASAKPPLRSKLDKAPYIEPGIMALEWEKVWSRCWLFAGLANDIPEPGDYFVYELGRESVVVLRDEAGINAFYNVCQHRGNRIFANTMGSVAAITCPYHGWQYRLDGCLQQVPDQERFEPAPGPQSHSLVPVQVAVWAGLVWINLDPKAQPLEDYLGSIMDDLAPYRFEQLVLVQHQTVALNANWKTVKDNFLEQYHVDFIHPQHASLVDCANSDNFLMPHGHSSTAVKGFVTNPRYPIPESVPDFMLPLLEGLGMEPTAFSGRVPAIRQAVQARKRALAGELDAGYDSMSDEQLSDVYQYDFFPNLFMTLRAEDLAIYGPRPHPSDPDRCYFDKWTLQLPVERGVDEAKGIRLLPELAGSLDDERPDHAVFTQQQVIDGEHSLTITFDQDIYYLADMQAGMHSRGFQRATLNKDEARLQHFHDWLESWMA